MKPLPHTHKQTFLAPWHWHWQFKTGKISVASMAVPAGRPKLKTACVLFRVFDQIIDSYIVSKMHVLLRHYIRLDQSPSHQTERKSLHV